MGVRGCRPGVYCDGVRGRAFCLHSCKADGYRPWCRRIQAGFGLPVAEATEDLTGEVVVVAP